MDAEGGILIIIGIGLDLVSVSEISEIVRSPAGQRFLQRVFGPEESANIPPLLDDAAVRSLSAHFAAKEATLKALGTGWAEGIRWHDVAITSSSSGDPSIILSGNAALLADQLGMKRKHLSLTHTNENAMAVVILEGSE